MAHPKPGKVVRIRRTRTEIESATRLAEEWLAAGRGAFEVEQIVNDAVGNRELSRAIVAHLQHSRARASQPTTPERGVGIYFGLFTVVLVSVFVELFRWMYGWVVSFPNEILPACGAALGQAILVRLSWRILKTSGIYLTDSLNCATYPTVLHFARSTGPKEDALRFERLTSLLAETVERRLSGSNVLTLYRELTEVELTKSAAIWLLVQAEIGVFIKSNFPPYQSRSRAYALAAGAAIGCAIGLFLVENHLQSVSQGWYLVVWAILFVSEFLRPTLHRSPKTA